MIEQNAEPRERRPGLAAVLTAPAMAWLDLSRIAARLARARLWQLAILLSLIVGVQVVLCVGMAVWQDTVRFEYPVSTTAPAGGPWWEVEPEFREYTLREVWTEWCARGNNNPAIPIFMSVATGTCAAIAVATLVFWQRVHRQGRLWPTLQRTFAAVLSATGFAWVMTAVIFTACNLIAHSNRRHGNYSWSGFLPDHIALLGGQLSILLMIRLIGRAVRAVSDAGFTPDLPPTCEGCGYDLTHRSASGACSECGASVDKSLTPGLTRRPTEYDVLPTPPGLFATGWEVLLRPQTFYGRLTVRTAPQEDDQFRVAHLTCILVAAFVWILLMMLHENHASLSWGEIYAIPTATLAVTIVAWALQHVVGAIVSFIWVLRGTLPDLRWGQRVLNYETVYLWLFCAFNGSLITSFIFFHRWLETLVGRWIGVPGFRVPSGFLVLMLPNMTLILFWFLRLLRAGRGVQWANF